ncbi:MAG TPA: sigma-70 family RNA polymerase sigma factor [Verrucomicrobiae bacterium]|nr:sigma-70 family RNA polymerase sigma factor [Verrucomicrobiae bacterium]
MDDAAAEALAGLVARVREHDETAARELVERLYPLVARVVHSHLPRREEPEDLMQEIFLKMFSKLDQFRAEMPFEHWVSRIALNTCLDRLRRQKVRPELRWADLSEQEQAVMDTVAADTEPSDADAPQALALLNRLLEQLPEADAWLLRQVELEEKSLADVCAAAGWNPGAARVRLFRARRRLQVLFRKLEKA